MSVSGQGRGVVMPELCGTACPTPCADASPVNCGTPLPLTMHKICVGCFRRAERSAYPSRHSIHGNPRARSPEAFTGTCKNNLTRCAHIIFMFSRSSHTKSRSLRGPDSAIVHATQEPAAAEVAPEAASGKRSREEAPSSAPAERSKRARVRMRDRVTTVPQVR